MKKNFNFFSLTKEGKGVKKEDVVENKNFGFINFFTLFGRRFWSLSGINLLYVFVNFPIFFMIFANNFSVTSSAPANLMYPAVYGLVNCKSSPILQTLFSLYHNEVSLQIPTLTTNIFNGLSYLTILTFGIANAGLAYIMRGYVRQDTVFGLTDFFEAIAKNWKQALPLGAIDILIMYLLMNAFSFWRSQNQFVDSLMFYFCIFAVIVYFFMRFYMYIIMITFDLSIFKIIKNSFIFAFIGIKRNIVGTLGILFVLLFNFSLISVFPMLGVMLPFIITISLLSFISAYAAYPNIYEIMIKPQEKERPEPEVNQVFTDRG